MILVMVPLYAGVTGKLAGTVTDAESGEPLIGVNVILAGSQLGASTDTQGRYFILKVPPGLVELSFSMIGYRPITMTQVRVDIDVTTTVDVKLSSQSVELGELIVTAQRPSVVPDIAGSQIYIRFEEFDLLPIASVEDVIGLQSGIEGLSIRGSGAYQSLYMIDGIPYTDERNNQPFLALPLNAIRDIQVMKGGFGAEYGNVRSGIINILTREGSRDHYEARATLRYQPPGPKQFGESIYGPNSYFLRPFMDEDVAWTGTASGAWDSYTQDQYVRFIGFNAISEGTMADDDPSNDLTPSAARQLFMWEHRRQGDIRIPDYTLDMGFGGPIPVISSALGNLRFYLSHRSEQEAFLYPLSRDAYGENSTYLKLTMDLGKQIKVNSSIFYGEIHSASTASWRTAPSGYYIRTENQLAGLVAGSKVGSVLYSPGYFNPLSIYRTIAGFTLSHVLSKRSFYEVTLKWNRNNYRGYRTRDRNLTKDNEIVPGYFVDEAPYGYSGFPSSSLLDGMSLGGWMGFAHDWSTNTTSSIRADFTSQFNPVHQLKMGVEFTYNDLQIHSANISPSNDFWNQRIDYERQPYRGSVYGQSKIEVYDFIMTLGVRADHSNTNGTWYTLDDYDRLFIPGAGNTLEDSASIIQTDPRTYFSPRISVSHPITVDSKLYFNYGHYNQLPQNEFRFKLDRIGNGSVDRIGDPNLPESRTVAYEVGYEHNFKWDVLLSLTGYYKDVTDQPSWTRYRSFDNKVAVLRATSDHYEDIRGFEIELKRRQQGWLGGFINYTYMIRTSGQFGYRNYFEDPNQQVEDAKYNPVQIRPIPEPYLRANINLKNSSSFGPSIMGLKPLASWKLTLLGTWKDGAYFTNPVGAIGVENDLQWRPKYYLDMRLSRNFKAGGRTVKLFADIDNALNLRFLTGLSAFSNLSDFIAYIESLHLPDEEGAQHGNDRPGDVRMPGVEYHPIETRGNPTQVLDPVERAIYYSTDGEPYTDTNGNGVWDIGELYEDLDNNGSWEPGESYWRYSSEAGWTVASQSFMDDVINNRAYIDMPNYGFLTFLYPRTVTIGLSIDF